MTTQRPLHPSSLTTRVPVEVWAEIFLCCLPEPGDHSCETINVVLPLTLTHVCTLWARIAHKLPRLWSSLTVTIKHGDLSPPISDAEKWLERSDSTLLTLALDQEDPSLQGSNLVEGAIALFARHIHRWKHVKMHRFVPPSIRAAGGDWVAPFLESFELAPNLFPNQVGRMPVDLMTLLCAAPALKYLRLSYPEVPPGSRIPWQQLSRLVHTGDCDLDVVFDIARKCPQLEDLTLSLTDLPIIFNYPAPAIMDTLLHCYLKSLRIEAAGEELTVFLERVTLPSLTELRILAPPYSPGGQPSIRAFNNFLERSGAKLEILSVIGVHERGDLAMFARNPNLQLLIELAMKERLGSADQEPAISAADFRSLIWGRGGGLFLLPNLRSLRLGGSCGFWERAIRLPIGDALTEMVASRRCPPEDRPCASVDVDLGQSNTCGDMFT